MKNHMTVANTIASQFGGNRSFMMIGAKNKAALNENQGGLSFKHMKTTIEGKPANHFKIVLNGNDLYDLEFGYVRGLNYTVRKTHKNVFAEDMVRLFEEATKLYLSL